MSKVNLGCVFCDERELESEGVVIVGRKDCDFNDGYWHELCHTDERNISAYITDKSTFNPLDIFELKINFCPMCGRRLYKGNEDRVSKWDF